MAPPRLSDSGDGQQRGACHIERGAVCRCGDGIAQGGADDSEDLGESGLLWTSGSIKHGGFL
ncbi:hypothetical protein BCR16_25100 (plasmid) [Ralstonia solanacearum FJAT-1458]|nr:hypothetical protein BCR16_25100 [Ralstonia solanacearum FJAT-1458]